MISAEEIADSIAVVTGKIIADRFPRPILNSSVCPDNVTRRYCATVALLAAALR